MYGTTMRNYNVNKSSRTKDDSIYSSKIRVKEQKAERKARDTRYIKIENNAKAVVSQSSSVEEREIPFSKKEFPIPSVIITALATVMLLVVISGLLII